MRPRAVVLLLLGLMGLVAGCTRTPEGQGEGTATRGAVTAAAGDLGPVRIAAPARPPDGIRRRPGAVADRRRVRPPEGHAQARRAVPGADGDDHDYHPGCFRPARR